MITLFNRREAYITYSMQEQSEIRSLLAQNGLDYSVKVINRKSPSPADAGSRARMGSFGENPGLMYEYIFYVHKDDIEKARRIVQARGK
ncbi:hypothetical protein EBB54_06095 [Schaedlerella arabinosiphila]|uniref:DUF2007 domain-containing protein n=1 Tax=Schaedlerella arabinosiphila TaxID=2044587 RepID=A0A426DDS6_9FIRM|nr:hypothetical protein [Schaedlerella arabinosiphila]RRK30987.1 hypothetical protein EBB54_06095 [Schaedlerella arabinosiphila]